MEPKSGYARLGDHRIAYQVVGDGDLDLIFTGGYWGSCDVEWENPLARVFFQQLASFARLIRFDRLGTGASDQPPVDSLPPWEAFAEEIEAVADETQADRPALMLIGDAGPAGILFAASRPERTRALILFNSTARYLIAEDYEIGMTQDMYLKMGQDVAEGWGTDSSAVARYFYPSVAEDPQLLAWLAKLQRGITSPTSVVAYSMASARADARAILDSVHVPTLVLQRIESPFTPPSHGRFLANHIEGAEFVELPGGDNYPYFEDPDAIVGHVERFLVGATSTSRPNRILASILFTDIVDSTRSAEELGDRRWSALLDMHDEIVRRSTASFSGRVVKMTGDGVLAVFDGPGRAIKAAEDLRHQLERTGLRIRAGIHTGEIDVRGSDVGGLAVHLGARIMAQAGAGEILVSSTVHDLIAGSDIGFQDCGKHQLKGIEGERQLYKVL